MFIRKGRKLYLAVRLKCVNQPCEHRGEKREGKSKLMVKVTVKNSEKFFIPEMTHSDKSTLNYSPSSFYLNVLYLPS